MSYSKEYIKKLYEIYLKLKAVYEAKESDGKYVYKCEFSEYSKYSDYRYNGSTFEFNCDSGHYTEIKELYKFKVRSGDLISLTVYSFHDDDDRYNRDIKRITSDVYYLHPVTRFNELEPDSDSDSEPDSDSDTDSDKDSDSD